MTFHHFLPPTPSDHAINGVLSQLCCIHSVSYPESRLAFKNGPSNEALSALMESLLTRVKLTTIPSITILLVTVSSTVHYILQRIGYNRSVQVSLARKFYMLCVFFMRLDARFLNH